MTKSSSSALLHHYTDATPATWTLIKMLVYHVFTVNQNNKSEFKTVKLGYVTTDHVQITEGLNEGDLVVVEGMEELKDGSKVQIMEYQSTAF